MVFGDKTYTSDRYFSPADLFQYIQDLIKELKVHNSSNSYIWLKSRVPSPDECDSQLKELKPLIFKMTPENCAEIAVKLDRLTKETMVTPNNILLVAAGLLEDHHNVQMMKSNLKKRGRKVKVHPQLTPPRQATVSFIL